MVESLERRLQREEHYRQFYRECVGLSTSFEKDVKRKKELLIKYFPKRFGVGGAQDLEARNYDDLQIGALFNYLLTYASKYVK